MSARWVDFARNGVRRYGGGELRVQFMDVGDARIFRFEDEVNVASGIGGTIDTVSVSYVVVPYTPDEVPR